VDTNSVAPRKGVDEDTVETHFAGLERLYACENCGRALSRKKLVEVTPDNSDGMHPFGLRVCRSCARRGGWSTNGARTING
jgi:hypothetical protein